MNISYLFQFEMILFPLITPILAFPHQGGRNLPSLDGKGRGRVIRINLISISNRYHLWKGQTWFFGDEVVGSYPQPEPPVRNSNSVNPS